MPWWETALRALWLFLPAYVANMAPVVVAKLLPWWNAPIDGGLVAKDGRRLLGAGKTWRGLAGGTVVAGAVALGIAALAPHWGLVRGQDFGLEPYREPVPCADWAAHGGDRYWCGASDGLQSPWWGVALFGCVMGCFALVGDAVKSYFKRRLGKEGGAPWVPFDQLDFVAFGLLGMLLFQWLLAPGWVWHALTDDWVTLATLVLLTPVLHFLVNVVGFALRLKKVPW